MHTAGSDWGRRVTLAEPCRESGQEPVRTHRPFIHRWTYGGTVAGNGRTNPYYPNGKTIRRNEMEGSKEVYKERGDSVGARSWHPGQFQCHSVSSGPAHPGALYRTGKVISSGAASACTSRKSIG